MSILALILLGPPGAGKGTQARKLAATLGIPRISTGDILRDAIREESAIGKEAQGYMEAGALVPDSLVDAIVKERVHEADCRNGFVLDGYPRNLQQAKFLEGAFESRDARILAIGIEVRKSVLIQRLTGRWTCQNCGKVFNEVSNPSAEGETCDNCNSPLVHRKDDSEKVIEERLQVYRKATSPLTEHYRGLGAYVEVNGEGPVEDIFQSILEIVRGKQDRTGATIH